MGRSRVGLTAATRTESKTWGPAQVVLSLIHHPSLTLYV